MQLSNGTDWSIIATCQPISSSREASLIHGNKDDNNENALDTMHDNTNEHANKFSKCV